MKPIRAFVALLFLLAWAHSSLAAVTEVSLILANDSAHPGDTVMAGIRLQMPENLHTYWRNPGDSGIATSIKWQLPPGLTAGDIQWPIPSKLFAEDITTYVYTNDVVLLVPLQIASNAPPGPLELKGKVRWLECDKLCVPGSADVQVPLTIGNESKPSANAALIANWQKKLPLTQNIPLAVSWGKVDGTNARPLYFDWQSHGAISDADFFPYKSDTYSFQPQAKDTTNGSSLRLEKSVKLLMGEWPAEISGLFLVQSNGTTVGYDVKVPVAAEIIPSAATPSSENLPQAPARSLIAMLLYAFLGGLILNIMPCVLPVIALKILGFVNQGGESPQRVRKLGLVYALGVLASFLALAGMVIAVKQAGHQAGWGMQFGNPEFIVVMTVLVTLVALNLFGLFEVNLSGKVMGAAGELSAREGSSGAFFNGVLATLLATPCTAPFLGVALGFAFGQPYAIIILMFLTVGAGLAIPYVILSWNPALLKLLPKPGAWMEKFKIAMGFPMLATAFWLFELTTVHYGKRVFWLGLFLVVVALAAWIYGEFVQRGRTRKGVSILIVAVILAGGYFYMLEDNLRWRSPLMGGAAVAAQRDNTDGIDWKPWSEKAVSEVRQAGHLVLVDFTADWCAVCQVNRKTSIEIARVKNKLAEINGVALEGDDTLLPETITRELQRYGRAGVPLVLVYPANLNSPPEVLPDGYLTPSIVLDALDRAAKSH